MASTQTPPTSAGAAESASRRPRGPSTSGERARSLAFVLGLVLLEALPVAAWLETTATLQAGDPNQSAIPLWFLALMLLVAVAVGRATARQAAAATMFAAVPMYLVSFVIAIRISPSAYGAVVEGPLDTAWLQTLSTDFSNGSGRISALFWLAILLGYLWWRGLRIGRVRATIEAVRTLFVFSFIAVVVAVAVASVTRGPGQQALSGWLAFLLPLEAFAGLATLAIARAGALADDRRAVVWTSPGERGPWTWLGIIIAGASLALSIVISLFASYDAIIAGLRALGPVGALIAAGLEWLLYGIVLAFYLVLGPPLEWLVNLWYHSKPLRPPQTPTPPQGVCPNPTSPTCVPNVPPASGIGVAVVLGVVLAVVIGVLLYIVYRAIKAMREAPPPLELVEERESLDVRGLLGAQLRDLLASLRRAPGQPEEALDARSVRAIYRDVLRAAIAAGLPRGQSETPDEYRDRLEQAPGGSLDQDGAGDFGALTDAYDRSRYGDDEPPEAEARTLLARGRRLIARLRANSRGAPGARGG